MKQLILLQRSIFVGRSERQQGSVNDLQGTLFELEALPEEKVVEKELITYERRKPSEKSSHAGRNPFPSTCLRKKRRSCIRWQIRTR